MKGLNIQRNISQYIIPEHVGYYYIFKFILKLLNYVNEKLETS